MRQSSSYALIPRRRAALENSSMTSASLKGRPATDSAKRPDMDVRFDCVNSLAHHKPLVDARTEAFNTTFEVVLEGT